MSVRAALGLAGAVLPPGASRADGGAPGGAGDASARRLRLLVVDDDAIDRLAVRRAARQAGLDAELTEAEDGDAALALLAAPGAAAGAPNGQAAAPAPGAPAFDCVLLDYQLPGTTGLDVLRALRAGGGPGAEVPVVMLTGQSDPETAVALIKAGAADFLPKGALSADRLARVVGGAVRVAEADRARRAAELAMRAALADAEQARAAAEAARAHAEAERERAEDANKAKSEFLAMMSHELRTPLNAIGGYVQLMQLGVPQPAVPAHRDYLERLRRSQQHLLGLINSVLNYAKLEAGAVTFDVAPVAAAELLAALEPLVAPLAAGKGLSYAARVIPAAGGGPLVARADREKAVQVLLNLVGNAVKFTPAGGRVTLEALEAPPGPGGAPNGPPHVAFRVADTGVGIAPDQLGRVFDPFVQVDAGYARTQEGTGLGLAISRDLARGMGGDLTAESAPGAGSTFTFVLPAA